MNITKATVVAIISFFIVANVTASPKSDYMIHCMGCHKTDGQGLPPDVPAFDSTLGDILGRPGGRAYLVQVPGASQAPLNNKKLAGVLNWLLHEFVADKLPQGFRDISREEVDQFRTVILKNPAVIRGKLLKSADGSG